MLMLFKSLRYYSENHDNIYFQLEIVGFGANI